MKKYLIEATQFIKQKKLIPSYVINYQGTRVPIYFHMSADASTYNFIPPRLYHIVKDLFRQERKLDYKKRQIKIKLDQHNLVFYCNVYLAEALKFYNEQEREKYFNDPELESIMIQEMDLSENTLQRKRIWADTKIDEFLSNYDRL